MTSHFQNSYQRLVRLAVLFELIFWSATILMYLVLPASREGSLKLLYPEWCWGFVLVPALLILHLKRWQWKSRLYEQYKGMGNTRMLWVTFHPLRYFLQYFFLRNIFFFLLLAMAQPVMGNRKVKGSKRVLDLVICLDISSSMNTMDIEQHTSRLTVAKRGITQLLNNLKGERISVVIFANDAYIQLPLTMDYGAAKLFIQEIETSMISDQGTNIGSALEVARRQFVDSESGHAILVITDGEDHEQVWKEEVAACREAHIELSYFGIGTTQGGLIPNDPEDPEQGYKREGGTAVVSRLDQPGMQKMAAESGAEVHFSDAPFPDMTSVVADISTVESKTVNNLEFTVQRNYFRIPLIVGLCSFLGYLFVPFFVKRNRQ